MLAQKGSHVSAAAGQHPEDAHRPGRHAEHDSPSSTYVATKKAANTYGARVGLKPGRTYTLDQLWYAVFLPSANDAAIAVAEANGGVEQDRRRR